MKFGCQQFCSNYNEWKSLYTARILCFNKNFKNRTISTGIPSLGLRCEKWSNWTSGVGQKNPTPFPSVVMNPTPPKQLRLFATPQLWCTGTEVAREKWWATLPLRVLLSSTLWSSSTVEAHGFGLSVPKRKRTSQLVDLFTCFRFF